MNKKSLNTLVEFSVTPLGLAGDGVSSSVAKAVKIVRASGFDHELHSMGTIVEAELEECLKLIGDCIKKVLEDAPRASVSIKMDVRPGKRGRIRSKVETVEKILKK